MESNMFDRKVTDFEAELSQVAISVGQNKFEDALEKLRVLISRKDLKQEEKNSLLAKTGEVLEARASKQNVITPGYCYE